MAWKTTLEQWLQQLPPTDDMRQQLTTMQLDERQVEDCFYKEIEFGTGGMRGIIGPGTNRINRYTVRKIAWGLAQYILEEGPEAIARGVVIAYDSRHQSKEFALEVAKTIGGEGIQVYLFDALRPTPVLSFAIRYLHAFAGVMITASHNPPEYNGLKVYGQDGAQLPPAAADVILQYRNRLEAALLTEVAEETDLLAQERLVYIGANVDRAYNDALQSIQYEPQAKKSVKIVFTALHGTGAVPMQHAFQQYGYEHITYVQEQQHPDPDFSTVPSPNPEEPAAFKLAMQYGQEQNADLLLATDPDADRLGVAVKDPTGEYVVLTGNQIGALLLHYILEQKQQRGSLPANGVMLKTIVTSELGRAIASSFNVETIDTLTGFKFIAEHIHSFEQTKERTFLFGYEESYGYLIGSFARDKDAIQAAMIVAEMAEHYQTQGQTIFEGLLHLFDRYGYYQEATTSIKLEGKDGAEQMVQLMDNFRSHPPTTIAGVAVTTIEDYATSEAVDVLTGNQTSIHLPTSNVLKYKLADDSWVCIRPSGTEPKCKFYFGVHAESLQASQAKLTALKTAIMEHVRSQEREDLHA